MRSHFRWDFSRLFRKKLCSFWWIEEKILVWGIFLGFLENIDRKHTTHFPRFLANLEKISAHPAGGVFYYCYNYYCTLPCSLPLSVPFT